MLSIIIPVYNEEKMIPTTITTIARIMQSSHIEYELVFANDGSTDNSWEAISSFAQTNPQIKAVSFSKNFGKEAAMMAGLAYAAGDACVIIDADLQHPPEKIVEMYELWQQGYKIVEGVKVSRGREGFFHKCFAKLFYRIISRALGINMQDASDFKLMDREVVDTILKMPEKQIFFRAISSWVGFKSTKIEFHVQERKEGTSKWSAMSLIKYAFRNITSFSSAPLQLVTLTGIIYLIFAIILSVHTLVQFFTNSAVEGFTTVIILQLITGSIIMLALGIIGYYISKIFEETKSRPRYIIEKYINLTKGNI